MSSPSMAMITLSEPADGENLKKVVVASGHPVPVLRSLSNFGSPAAGQAASPGSSRKRTPRSRMKRSQSVVEAPRIDKAAEERRWGDVILGREAVGVKSPLRIHPNPLRLFEPSRVQSLTGSAPIFDVVLEDPFLATPDRKQQRALLNRQTTQLAFSLGTKDAAQDDFGLPAGAGRLPTPRLTAGEEAALLFADREAVSPVRTGRKAATKLKRRSGWRVAATVPRSLAAIDAEMEHPEGQRTPRFASLRAMTQWVVQHGEPGDKAVLALTHRVFFKSSDLLTTIQSLFVLDTSEGREFRVGALEFVSRWLDVLPFFSPGSSCKDAVLAQMEEFVGHTAAMHGKMLTQRHTQAQCYAAAPELLARLQSLRAALAVAGEARASSDFKLFYRKSPNDPHAVLRGDTEQVAVTASAGLAEVAVAEQWPPSVAGGSAWRSMDVRRMAAAMTAVDAGMFASLSGKELLRGARSGLAAVPNCTLNGRRVVRINHIVTITQHWNALSRWVPTAVLFLDKVKHSEAERAKSRAKLLRKFIDLAAELREMENWSAFFAIVIGLGSSTLSCLKETWKLVPAKHAALFRELEEACQPVSNFRMYRESLAKCMETGTFCIPYLAIVLKDLQAVEEGNPNKNARGLFNFEKLQLLCDVTTRVRMLQLVPCPVKTADRKYLQFVATVASKSENELWDQSRLVKEAETAMAALPAKRFGTFGRH